MSTNIKIKSRNEHGPFVSILIQNLKIRILRMAYCYYVQLLPFNFIEASTDGAHRYQKHFVLSVLE